VVSDDSSETFLRICFVYGISGCLDCDVLPLAQNRGIFHARIGLLLSFPGSLADLVLFFRYFKYLMMDSVLIGDKWGRERDMKVAMKES